MKKEQNLKLFHTELDCMQVTRKIIAQNNIKEWGPGTMEKLLCFIQKHVTQVLDEAKSFMESAGRDSINVEDVSLVLELMKNEDPERNKLTQKELIELAKETNEKPLPEVKSIFGIPIPSQGDYCLNKPNFRRKFLRQNHVVDTPKHQLFSPMSMRFPNLNLNLKNRMGFLQQTGHPMPCPNPLFRFNSLPGHFPMMTSQKQRMHHSPSQKINIKPRTNFRSNIENINMFNVEQRKEIIKRPVCTEPQKIIFKPKLLLSLNTNVNNNVKHKFERGDESCPIKRKKF